MMGDEQERYWRVQAVDGDVYVYASKVFVLDSGALFLEAGSPDLPGRVELVMAPGYWRAVFPAEEK